MNSFYSTLYGKFVDLQIDPSFSAKIVYPSRRPVPSLKAAREISDCVVRIPAIEVADNRITYGPFVFEDNEFGQAASVKLAVASSCLLSAKTVLYWSYRDQIEPWLASKNDLARAEFSITVIFDRLSKERIRHVQGDEFHDNIMLTADMLGSILLNRNSSDFGMMMQTILASYLLGDPMHAAAPVSNISQNFVSKLDRLDLDPVGLVNTLRNNLLKKEDSSMISGMGLEWEKIVELADDLYKIIERVPGKWHLSGLPYAAAPDLKNHTNSIFQSKIITEKALINTKQRILQNTQNSDADDSLWKEIFFEMLREENRKEKTKQKLIRATGNLNFGSVGFPASDFVTYSNLYSELAPNIRRMVERVRLVKNMLDENAFEETGTIDMQVAIQAIASETARNDIFVKEENLLKSECWTILVDSSLSLDGSSRQLKSVSICLAETAREIMGTKPWGMFAFSDDLYCLKDFNEPYGAPSKARIGGLSQTGLSHIPDAIRACRKLLLEYSCEKNYLILVSDGIPSGYPGIEEEFASSVKELGKYGIDLAAIGIGSASIKRTIRKARVVDKPDEIVKEFMEIYYGISS